MKNQYKINIKKIAFALLSVLLMSQMSFSQEKRATISGTTDHTEPMVIHITTYDKATQTRKIDSSSVVSGKFSFSVAFTGLASSVLISATYNGQPLTRESAQDLKAFLVDEHGANVYIKDKVKQASITNDPMEDEKERYIKATYIPEADSLGMHVYVNGVSPMVLKISGNTDTQSEQGKKQKAFMDNQARFLVEKLSLQKKFIAQNPDSYFSISAIETEISNGTDLAGVPALIGSLSQRLQNSDDIKVTRKLLAEKQEKLANPKSPDQIANQIANRSKTLAIGTTAPNFTLISDRNTPISLSDFKGKYVLVDFWASWCVPCREENPNLIKAYNDLKNRNFTVLGVALEEKRAEKAWHAAIKADGLPWSQVADFDNNVAAKLYNVQSIPTNYLIDPKGKIIAVNLRGQELQKKLAEVLTEF